MLMGREKPQHLPHMGSVLSGRDGTWQGREQMAAQTVGLFLHFVLKLQSLIAGMNLQGGKGNTRAGKALPVCPETALSSH